MSAVDLSQVGAGFLNQTNDSQQIFRAALEALSHPGRHVKTETTFDPPPAVLASSAGLLLALLEPGSRLWLSSSLRESAASSWLIFHTSCALVNDPAIADFAWINAWSELPPLSSFSQGTDEYPDQSTTCVLDLPVTTLEQEPASYLILTGPGIQATTTLSRRLGTPEQLENFTKQWDVNHSLFPRGLDIFFATETGLIGLPRTTRVSNVKEKLPCT